MSDQHNITRKTNKEITVPKHYTCVITESNRDSLNAINKNARISMSLRLGCQARRRSKSAIAGPYQLLSKSGSNMCHPYPDDLPGGRTNRAADAEKQNGRFSDGIQQFYDHSCILPTHECVATHGVNRCPTRGFTYTSSHG